MAWEGWEAHDRPRSASHDPKSRLQPIPATLVDPDSGAGECAINHGEQGRAGRHPTSVPIRRRKRVRTLGYRTESRTNVLKGLITKIRALADGEKESLGFLPGAAYDEAVTRGRIVAMLLPDGDRTELVGFVLFSGVFPNAKIQQIVVASGHRRRGVASALIALVAARHEAGGYLRLTAAVADDLPIALAFYGKNGFEAAGKRAGGSARGRTIGLRARDLGNEHLLSILERPNANRPEAIDLGLRVRGAELAPLYAIDLNVLFDAVKGKRERAPLARKVIGAGLAHRLRLVTTPEFLVELERNTGIGNTDPLLEMARQLPRLPDVDRIGADALALVVHLVVFGPEPLTEGRRTQAASDARHLAQAAIARASGFITSDGRMLDARTKLMDEVGIDLLSLDEIASLIEEHGPDQGPETAGIGHGLAPVRISKDEATQFLARHQAWPSLVKSLAETEAPLLEIEAMMEDGEPVGVAARFKMPAVDAPARIVVHVRTDYVRADFVAEALIASQCRRACAEGPILIEAEVPPARPSCAARHSPKGSSTVLTARWSRSPWADPLSPGTGPRSPVSPGGGPA